MLEHFCQTTLYAELLDRAYGMPTAWMDGVPYYPRRWTDRWAGRFALRGWESVGAPRCEVCPVRVRLPRYRGDLRSVRRYVTYKTWLIDLQSWEAPPAIDKALRRARRQGIHVRQIEDINDWRANYWPLVGDRGRLWNNANLLREAQWQFSLGQHAYFIALLELADCYGEGAPVGGLGFFWWDGVATEILSRIKPGPASHFQIQEPLHVACFEYAKQLGCKTFDLCPGGTEGIETFKRKFGGQDEDIVTAYV